MKLRCLLFAQSMLVLTVSTVAQVNLQTGAAEQVFPLINYMDGKAGIGINIGLAYSSGNGLYVNDVASNVGTGFSLDAGGLIVRAQNGEPDDQREWTNNKFWEYTNRDYAPVLKNYPNGYMYNPHVGKGCNIGLSYYPVFKKPAVYKELNVVASDMEQDKFIFKMNGREGVFVIGRDWKVTTLGDTRLKIAFTTADMSAQGIRTTINQFTITTEDGIKYTFRDKGLSYQCRYKYSGRTAGGQWQPIQGNPDDGDRAVNRFWGYKLDMAERPLVVNSWFLSEIENTNNGQKVLYVYDDVSNDIVAAKLISHQRDLNNSGTVRWCYANQDRINNGRQWYQYLSNPINANNYSWNTALLNQLKPGPTSLLYSRAVSETKRLAAISLPNGGWVNIRYSGTKRADLPGESALTTIEYWLNGKMLRGYRMEYGYFFKNTIRPYSYNFSSFEAKFARLCLLSVQKIGNGEDNASEPPYRFGYYLGSSLSTDDIVPARNYLSQDHWGYYNGANSGLPVAEDHDFLADERNQYFKTVLPRFKNAKEGYAKNGLLRTVSYPTGGRLEYFYAQNRPSGNILPSGNVQLAGGVSVSRTRLHDGESTAKDIIKEYNYRNALGQNARWGDEAPTYHSFSITEYNEKWFNKKFVHPGLSYPEMASSVDWGKIIGKALISAAINIAFSAALKAILAGTAALPVINIIVFVIVVVKMVFDASKTFEFHRYILSNVNNKLSNPLPSFNSMVEVRDNSPGEAATDGRYSSSPPLPTCR
jgi:hypothetical protein